MIEIQNVNHILIDGTSYLYRAYYACPLLSTNSNKPCGAIYGTLNMIRKILLKYPIHNIIIIFDSPEKTFRSKIFSEYKKNRPKMPNILKEQIQPLCYIIKNIGIPIISISNFEADDIIGTLIKKLTNKNNFILISTNDKDLAQLVNINVNILIGTSNIILDEHKVKKKYGVVPKLIPDLLGLMGDSSDNIPGIPKIGKKTALSLLKEFGSLNNVYKNINNISQYKFKKSKTIKLQLKTHKNIAFLSKKLATIKTNVPIPFKELYMSPPFFENISSFFKNYEFKHWSKLLSEGTWLKKKS